MKTSVDISIHHYEEKNMTENYTFLTKLYSRWTVYIDETPNPFPYSMELKVICSTYGEYHLTFLLDTMNFIPKEEGLLRLKRRVGEGFISTLRDICIYLSKRSKV